jgi:hypothetical protein
MSRPGLHARCALREQPLNSHIPVLPRLRCTAKGVTMNEAAKSVANFGVWMCVAKSTDRRPGLLESAVQGESGSQDMPTQTSQADTD